MHKPAVDCEHKYTPDELFAALDKFMAQYSKDHEEPGCPIGYIERLIDGVATLEDQQWAAASLHVLLEEKYAQNARPRMSGEDILKRINELAAKTGTQVEGVHLMNPETGEIKTLQGNALLDRALPVLNSSKKETVH